jgi:hypothetical protein
VRGFYRKDIAKIGGSGIMAKYGNSVVKMLENLFPGQEWLPWKYNCPKEFWGNVNNQRKYLDWLGIQINVKEMSDWYKIARKDFIENDGRYLLNKYNGSPSSVVTSIYSEYNWDLYKFPRASSKYWELLFAGWDALRLKH